MESILLRLEQNKSCKNQNQTFCGRAPSRAQECCPQEKLSEPGSIQNQTVIHKIWRKAYFAFMIINNLWNILWLIKDERKHILHNKLWNIRTERDWSYQSEGNSPDSVTKSPSPSHLWGPLGHTWYLSFFLHGHYFWLKFSPHNSV